MPRTLDKTTKMPARRKSLRKKNTGRREAGRDYLTGLEVGELIAATRGSRNEARDRCLLLLIFRHGLRVSEACRLKFEQVDTKGKVLHIARLKRGFSTTHPVRKQGSIVQLPDCLIAAVAVRLGLPLATGNTEDFQAIQRTGVALHIENWRNT